MDIETVARLILGIGLDVPGPFGYEARLLLQSVWTCRTTVHILKQTGAKEEVQLDRSKWLVLSNNFCRFVPRLAQISNRTPYLFNTVVIRIHSQRVVSMPKDEVAGCVMSVFYCFVLDKRCLPRSL